MIKQEGREISIFCWRLLELSLVYKLTTLVRKLEVHLVVGAELELLMQTAQVEAIFSLARLRVNPAQEISDHSQDLGKILLVRITFFRILENVF